MPGSTTRAALPYPLLTDPADISTAVQPLAARLDAIMAGWLIGTGAARPAAAATNAGFIYYTTDSGVAYVSDGATWQRMDLNLLNRVTTLEGSVTALQFATTPAIRLARSTPSGNLPTTGPSYTVPWDVVTYTNGGVAAPGLPVSGFTIPTAGLWGFDAAIQYRGSFLTFIRTYLQVNGTTIAAHVGEGEGTTQAPVDVWMGISTKWKCNAGDVIAVVAVTGDTNVAHQVDAGSSLCATKVSN